jgi:hypothetical protein
MFGPKRKDAGTQTDFPDPTEKSIDASSPEAMCDEPLNTSEWSRSDEAFMLALVELLVAVVRCVWLRSRSETRPHTWEGITTVEVLTLILLRSCLPEVIISRKVHREGPREIELV